MKRYFLKLFDFDNWAMQRLLDALTELPPAQRPPRSQAIFAHLIGNYHNWYGRLVGQTPALPLWPDLPASAWAAEWAAIAQRMQVYIQHLDENDFSRPVTYANSQGTRFSTAIEDILTHLLAHSCYHQGQLITLLKGLGEPLPDVMYIGYVRQQAAAPQ